MTDVYFDQLTFAIGRNSACHPAYQVVATASKSPSSGEDGAPVPLEGAAEEEEDAGGVETAMADEGCSWQVGAARAGAAASARSDNGNMCNMLAGPRKVRTNVNS